MSSLMGSKGGVAMRMGIDERHGLWVNLEPCDEKLVDEINVETGWGCFEIY